MSEKLIISGLLTGAQQAASAAFRLGSTLIVTRLLAPEIFGLSAVIVTFHIILGMVTDFGIRSMIIVSDDAEDPKFLQTCWSVQVARGLFLCGAVQMIALLLYVVQQAGAIPEDTTYGAEVLPLAIAISGLQLAIGATTSVNIHVYAKKMLLARATALNIGAAAFAPVVTILIALHHPSIWAFVISGMMTAFLRTVVSNWLFKGPPMRWHWDPTHVANLYRHGRWIIPNSALTAATNYSDFLIISAFLPPAAVGVYFIAKQLIQIPMTYITKLQGTVSLQVFRNLTALGERAVARNRYYRFRLPIDLLAGLFAGGALTAGTALIDLMYDARYLDAGWILEIAALGLPLISMNIVQNTYAAQRRFDIMLVFSVIRTTTIWGGLVLALVVFNSLFAAVLVVALHKVPEIGIVMVVMRRQGWIDIWRELRLVLIVVIGALVGWGFSEIYFSTAAAGA